MKVKVQIFHNDYTCEITNGELKNEEIIVGPYRFSARKVRPFIINKLGIFSQPLYIFKSVSMVPLAFEQFNEVDNNYSLTYIEPIQDLKFYERDLRFNPEFAKAFTNMTFMKEMMKYVGMVEKGEGTNLKKIFLILGFVLILVGVLAIFLNPDLVKSIAKALNIPI